MVQYQYCLMCIGTLCYKHFFLQRGIKSKRTAQNIKYYDGCWLSTHVKENVKNREERLCSCVGLIFWSPLIQQLRFRPAMSREVNLWCASQFTGSHAWNSLPESVRPFSRQHPPRDCWEPVVKVAFKRWRSCGVHGERGARAYSGDLGSFGAELGVTFFTTAENGFVNCFTSAFSLAQLPVLWFDTCKCNNAFLVLL